MKLCYLDETGNTGKNLLDPQQPYFILGGLVVTSTQWRQVVDGLKRVIKEAAQTIFPLVEASIKVEARVCRAWSKRFLQTSAAWEELSVQERRRLLHRIEGHLADKFEVHAVHLMHGRNDFEGVGLSERLTIVDKMLSVAEQNELQFLYAIIDKQRHARQYVYPDPPDELAFMLMTELFESYLAEVEGEKTGMFIADYSAKGGGLKADLTRYQEKGTPYYYGMSISRIIDSVHFVRSLDSPCTQLSDLCTYLILQRAKSSGKWEALVGRVERLVKKRKVFP